jgi:uncharacterized glyoxalase superfamily protein PhnB
MTQPIDWLCRALGFEVRLKVEGDGGRIEHSELVYGEALIMVARAETGRDTRSSRAARVHARSTEQIPSL